MSVIGEVETASGVPVTSTGVPIRNLWYMLLYAWREVKTIRKWKAEVESAPTLDALLAKILSRLMQQRMRVGLGRGYVDERSTIRGIRGRVDFAKSLKELAFQHGRANCRFQIFSPNVPKNQIVRTTLARLAQVGDFGPACNEASELRQKLRRLVQDLDVVEYVELKPEFVRRQQLLRHDADYRLMLTICDLVLERQMPTEVAGAKDLHVLDRDGMTLWRIFERFIANFYQIRLSGWKVSPQETFYWPTVESCEFVPVMRPDVVLRHMLTGTVVVLDTKFTAKCLVVGQWEKMTFQRDHLFQIYAYLRTQEHVSEEFTRATGLLLYPAVKHELMERIEVQGHRIRWETIDLALPWREIEGKLLQMIQSEAATARA